MDIEALLPDSLRITADRAMLFILEHPENLDQLLQSTFSTNHKLGMRASRVVLLCYNQKPKLILPHLTQILDHLIVSKNNSTIRNILHLFIKDFKLLDEKRFGKLLEFCFNLLGSASSEIAHRALAMQILYNISNTIPEFKDELKAMIEFHYEEGSPGFRSSANKILKKLDREILL